MYDLIGDIHGHAEELKAVLHKMGDREQRGVWQHPKQRQVIFLGDFVDRGPQQVETVTIARNMVENGHALAVMGNHEFNAVAWATEHPEQPGQYLREHSDKNLEQHREFLEQVGEGSDQHREMIDWFKTLPVYLDLPELRVAHACWHPHHLDVIQGYTDSENCLLSEAWITATEKGHEAYDAIETLLKCLEVRLPEGHYFKDRQSHKRQNIRTRWWETDSLTYRDLSMVPDDQIKGIPNERVLEHDLPGYDSKKTVFVGHYWINSEPKPLSGHAVCLDYSVAGCNGSELFRYRFESDNKVHICGYVC